MNMPTEQPKKSGLSRRQFLTTAGGVTFAIAAGTLGFKYLSSENKVVENLPNQDITAWVKLNSAGKVTFYNPAAEMGQGSMTALAVIFAEEMDVDWDDVQIEAAPIEPKIYGLKWSGALGGPMLTVGSRTIKGYYKALRHAGAQARHILLQQAAGHWGLPLKELTTATGQVIHQASQQKIGYGKLASMMAEMVAFPETQEVPESAWKKPTEFRLIGKDIPRRDIPAKVDGTAQFSIDVQLPEMVYSAVSRSPVNGATPSLQNADTIRQLDGVIDLVKLDHGIGVVAETFEQALSAKQQLQIDWSTDAKAEDYDSIAAFKQYQKLTQQKKADGKIVQETGDVAKALRSAHKRYDLAYRNDFLYHAQMEPLNAVVSVATDKQSAEVWVGTQALDSSRQAVAKVLDIDFSKVKLHPCYLGGGFGRRSKTGFVEEAALISAQVGRPVKVIWTREDDVQYGAFRPISVQRMQAGVDKDGNITAWKHCIAGTGGGLLGSGGKNKYYTLPNQHIEVRSIDQGIRTKHWRAVGHGANKYAIETFIDEIAHDLKRDSLEYRLQLMREHPRETKVLQEVARLANWSAPLASGRARGLSVTDHGGSFAAGIVEISLDESKQEIKVHHFWTAVDAGIIIQPGNTKAQIEGGIIMGISSVLQESITFKNGKVQQSNFHDYPILKMSDAPESIAISLIESEEAPTSIGELSLPLVGGAIANAFLSLTGKPLRHMPFNAEKIRAVLGLSTT